MRDWLLFDKSVFFVYTLPMKRRTVWFILLGCLYLGNLSALPVSSELALGFHAPFLPYDTKIGQLVCTEEGSVEAKTIEALSSPYSLQWVETYVPKDLQFGFVHSFDAILSSLLPQKAISTAKAVNFQELQEVAFRFKVEETGALQYGTFVWIELEEGVYNLVSISLEP